EAGDAGEDFVCGLGPDEGLGFRVAGVDELSDCLLEFGNATVTTATGLLRRQLSEPALDQVQPRAVGRGEVDVEARSLDEPSVDDRGLVSTGVGHDRGGV